MSQYPKLESFACINPALQRLMQETSPWGDFFYPVFGSNHFPISYRTNVFDAEPFIAELCSLRGKLSRPDVLAYNEWLLKAGLMQQVPRNLDGVCVKGEKGACKATPEKWSCGGCGLSWVPGSYMSKTCKQHPLPFWEPHLRQDIQQLLDQHGVSDTAPIIWVNSAGERRFKPKA